MLLQLHYNSNFSESTNFNNNNYNSDEQNEIDFFHIDKINEPFEQDENGFDESIYIKSTELTPQNKEIIPNIPDSQNDNYLDLFWKVFADSTQEKKETINQVGSYFTHTSDIKDVKMGLKRGRRTKEQNEKGEKGLHDKNKDDNIIKKIVNIIKKGILLLINNLIIKYGKKNMTLKNLSPVNQKVDFNKKLLYQKLKDIYSTGISRRFKNFDTDYNKDIITQLMNERDETIRDIFTSLFNLTFSDCLKHLRKEEFFPQLNGMGDLDSILEKYNDDQDYKEKLKQSIFKFEEIIQSKTGRNRIKH